MPVDRRARRRLFERYGESHRHPTNKAIHWVCVPLITWSVIALFWSAAPAAAYVSLRPRSRSTAGLSLTIAVGMLAVAAVMVYPLTVSTTNDADGRHRHVRRAWIGQFVGHRIEGKKPSFFDDVNFLLVGPAWLLGDVYRRVGLRY